jgi:hypothetical protein
LAFSYWFDKPRFLTEGKLATVLIIPSSWGSQLGGYLPASHTQVVIPTTLAPETGEVSWNNKVVSKGQVEVYHASVDELLQFHQLKRNFNHFDKFI